MTFDKLSLLHVDKKEYFEYEKDIIDTNATGLALFSIIALVVFAAMSLVSLFESALSYKTNFYIAYFCVSLLFFFTSRFIKKLNNTARTIIDLLFCFILLNFGVVMGTVMSPDQLTVSYIVLMMAVPLVFITRPIYMNIVILLSMALYLPLAYFNQPAEVFRDNMYDVIPYGILSMVIAAYMMKMKIQRIILRKQSSLFEKSSTINKERIEEYDRFITDMIRYSSEEGDVDNVINQIMAYIGENLHSDRAYIFEQNAEGNYDNTYEWCRAGVTAEKDNLQNVPYEGVIDAWIKEYKTSHNVLVYNIETYKTDNQALYEILKAQNITSLVTGPITINGKIVGFYGVDNPPLSHMDDISELIHINEFVISMMIRLKNNDKALERTALYDQLTGCKNRMALDWAYRGEYEPDESMALIMCDLNGLKEVNDKQGHEAGDRFICRAAETLSDVFGKESVYRLGGDEFLVILEGKTREQLDELIEMCKIQVGQTACIGVSLSEHIGNSFVDKLKEADADLYKQKDLFYLTRKKYREV